MRPLLALLLGLLLVLTACGSATRPSRSAHPNGSDGSDYSVAAVRAAFGGQGIHLDHGLGPPTGGGFALLVGRRSHLVHVAVYEGPEANARVKPTTGRFWHFARSQYRRHGNVFVWSNRADNGAVAAALSALQ
jgi:hypothetical protein